MVSPITIRKADDWHLRVPDDEMLKAALPHTAIHFGRAGPDERAIVHRGGETIEWKVVSA